MVGCPDALCTVIGFVFEIAKGECARGKMVLVGSCIARDNAAFEVSILFDVDVKAAASREESCLLACTAVVGVDISFVPRCANGGCEEFSPGGGSGDFRIVGLWRTLRCVCGWRILCLTRGFG